MSAISQPTQPNFYVLSRALLAVVVLTLGACANKPTEIVDDPAYAFVVSDTQTVAARFAPVFVPQDYSDSFNRIGSPSVRLEDDKETIYVNTSQPALFFQTQNFESKRGQALQNLIYRAHFERVPFPDLTAGRNGGLLIVITLNAQKQPLLVTTVHTCGCYLAIIPTNHLDEEAYPPNWQRAEQRVYGETLPGLLSFPRTLGSHPRIAIYTRDETHRIMDLRVISHQDIEERFTVINTALHPMLALKKLPLPGEGTTSIYHDDGFHQGYVKDAFKPLEFTFMSWWALDFHVGSDKELGDKHETGTTFYTSLKPWNRAASDMWDFANFLEFWGWTL